MVNSFIKIYSNRYTEGDRKVIEGDWRSLKVT